MQKSKENTGKEQVAFEHLFIPFLYVRSDYINIMDKSQFNNVVGDPQPKQREVWDLSIPYKNLPPEGQVHFANTHFGDTFSSVRFEDDADVNLGALFQELTNRYIPKKLYIKKLLSYMEDLVSENTYNRVSECCDIVQHVTTKDYDAMKVHFANSCTNRFCPICSWTKAKKDALMLAVLMEAIYTEKEYEFVFVTLTIPNVVADDLEPSIRRLNGALSKLFRRKIFQKVNKGYVRKLEVTYNDKEYITKEMFYNARSYFEARDLYIGDKNPNFDTYHPHIHLLVAVNSSYFTSRDYIKRDTWLKNWREVYGDQSITQVDVRKVNSKPQQVSEDSTFSQDVTKEGHFSTDFGAVAEMAKYTAKGNHLLYSRRVFETFYKALKSKQFITFNGVFKEYVTLYKKGDLDHYKPIDENFYEFLITSLWNKKEVYDSYHRELTHEEKVALNSLDKEEKKKVMGMLHKDNGKKENENNE